MAEKLELGPRLRAIAELVPESCRCLADIGTDHGYLPAALLLEGRIGRAVAADIGQPPLEHARRTAGRLGLEDGIDFRLGDGMAVLTPGEADVAVIAGMGGDTIISILDAAPWSREGALLLLQPMSKAEALRSWLPLHGYRPLHEELVQDKGVLYPILAVRGGDAPPASPAQAWGGFLLEGDPLWGRYLEDRVLRLRRAAAGLEKARDPGMADKRRALLETAAGLEEWKGAWERANGT